MTEEEVRRRAPEIAKGLMAIDDLGDEDEQRETLEALMKALDDDRTSFRPRSA